MFDKNSSRQGSGEAIGSGVLSVIVPNLLLSRRFAPFSFCRPARRAWASLTKLSYERNGAVSWASPCWWPKTVRRR